MIPPAPPRPLHAPSSIPFQAAGLLSLAMIFAAPGAAPAQEAPQRIENGARFGAWTVACDAVAVNETICVLTQRLVEAEEQGLLAELLAFNDAEEPLAYVVARVPLGVHFPAGFALRPEAAEDPLSFEWQSCSAQFCEALLTLDSAALAALEGGGEVLAGYVPAPDADALLFRVNTDGLEAALSALARALDQPGVAAAEMTE